ncbi:MAG TPA: hypothetical protein VEA99_18495 [Gemmatimonadaceae bacterium]|nr:hypothetical protein [Gemmatimonadaceae bacterium]
MSLPNVSSPGPAPEPSPIAGSVLPIQRAEELLLTLPGVISARIMADPTGAVEEIHVLTTDAVSPKQTVRNIESALIAHLGMRVSHKKISVAMTSEGSGPRPRFSSGAHPVIDRLSVPQGIAAVAEPALATPVSTAAVPANAPRRALYFEDIEIRRSRSRGVLVRVSLKKGDEEFVGEAEGMENERIRVELAARATLNAIAASGESRAFALEGYRMLDAFEREFVFVGVTVRAGRETVLLTGSAEVRESAETASVLAVLDATNRWVAFPR